MSVDDERNEFRKRHPWPAKEGIEIFGVRVKTQK